MTFLDDAAQAKGAHRGALLRALAGRPDPVPEAPAEDDDVMPPATFDGGARQVPWPFTPGRSHGETLMEIVRQSRGQGSTW